MASLGFSVLLMILFGWQGGTCVDEWTMASSTIAMGATLLLAGSGAYSVDNLLLRRDNWLATRPWFRWMAGSLPLPLTNRGFRFLALALLAAVLAFILGTYDYYRGSIVTAYHGGPVSPTIFHVTLSDAVLTPQALRFHAYLDAGSGDNPAHILEASLLAADGSVLAHWDMQALSHLPAAALHNIYAYNKFTTGPYGLDVGMGAKAVIELPIGHAVLAPAGMILRVTTVDGDSFSTVGEAGGLERAALQIHHDPTADLAGQDLSRQPRQILELRRRDHALQEIERQVAGEPGPGLLAPRLRAHHGIDAQQIDPAQQEGDHRRLQLGPARKTAGRHRGVVFELGQHLGQRAAAHRIDAAGPALGLQRLARGLLDAGALDDRGRAQLLEIIMGLRPSRRRRHLIA